MMQARARTLLRFNLRLIQALERHQSQRQARGCRGATRFALPRDAKTALAQARVARVQCSSSDLHQNIDALRRDF